MKSVVFPITTSQLKVSVETYRPRLRPNQVPSNPYCPKGYRRTNWKQNKRLRKSLAACKNIQLLTNRILRNQYTSHKWNRCTEYKKSNK